MYIYLYIYISIYIYLYIYGCLVTLLQYAESSVVTWGIQFPDQGWKLALEAWSLSHRTTRKVPIFTSF